MNDDCQKIRDHIADLISGTLPEANEQTLQEHLNICTDCRKYVQALEQEDASLTDHFAQIDADMASRQGRVLEAIGCHHPNPKTDIISIWREIMRRRISKLAVAAAIIFATGFGIHWISSGTAYGLTEALQRCQNADVIHIKGWFYQRPGEEAEFVKTPNEYWMDRKNGCYKSVRTIGFIDLDPNRPAYYLRVFDGEYVMKTGYSTDSETQQTTPRASYTKLGPFLQRIEARTMAAFPEFVEHLSEVKGFAKVGQEPIKGRTTDVWEGEIVEPGQTIPYKKLRVSLCPSTGEILRIVRWSNEKKDSIQWVLTHESHTIEYDVAPPADCFSTDPPDGHQVDSTKETAAIVNFGDDTFFDHRIRFYGCIGFTLNDGTVIYGWHANDKPEQSQAHLFTEVVPGGPLPKLPARVVALKPRLVERDPTLAGRHLAWTQKGKKFYEWGIYVADTEMPKRETFGAYKIIQDYDDDGDSRRFGGRPLLMSPEFAIKSEKEFNTWVRAAMAELSDDGVAPEHVTYENVMALARQIRSSLHP